MPNGDNPITLAWPVMGDRIRADHNYRLYSAMIDACPELKEQDWQLKTINGIPSQDGWIKLGRESRLAVRCSIDCLKLFGKLDGQVMRVGQSMFQLGELTGMPIEPVQKLASRIVVIRHAGQDYGFDKVSFAVSLGKKIAKLGVERIPTITSRRSLRVKDSTIIGFAVKFDNLNESDSLLLQQHGLGAKRKMGCGFFEEYFA